MNHSAVAPQEVRLLLGGALFAAGWLAAPLLACGFLKIACDLALWQSFRRHSGNSTLREQDRKEQ